MNKHIEAELITLCEKLIERYEAEIKSSKETSTGQSYCDGHHDGYYEGKLDAFKFMYDYIQRRK